MQTVQTACQRRQLCRNIMEEDHAQSLVVDRVGTQNDWNSKLLELKTCGTQNDRNSKLLELKTFGTQNLWNSTLLELSTFGTQNVWNSKLLELKTFGAQHFWNSKLLDCNIAYILELLDVQISVTHMHAYSMYSLML